MFHSITDFLYKHRRIVGLILVCAIFLFVATEVFAFFIPTPEVTSAGEKIADAVVGVGKKAAGYVLGGLADLTSTFVGTAVFLFMSLLSVIFGIVIMFLSWVVQIILQLNNHISDSPTVRLGFQISLAIANLGFVLAIVIIAIATILRRETYGVKQNLARLILAALLVNFGLVIATPIMGFANELTSYFLEGITPGGNPVTKILNFSNALSGSFTPQKFTLISDKSNVENIVGAETLEGFAAAMGQSSASQYAPIVSVIFVVLAFLGIALTLVGLIIMFIIRYITLSILLILMPFAWLSWILPALRQWWTRWWSSFFRWTLFAPVAVFFLYLSIATQTYMADVGEAAFGAFNEPQFQSPAENEIVAALSTFFGSFLAGLLKPMLEMTVILALTIGGLYAANRLSIIGAAGTLSAATAVGKTFAGYVGRRARQAGGAAAKTETGQKFTKTLQEFGTKGGKLQKFITTPVRYAGRGLEAAGAAGEKLVGEAESRLKNYTDDQLAHGMPTFSAPERMFAIKRLRDNKNLGKIENIERYLGEDKADEFKRYNQEKLYKEGRDASGLGLRDLVAKRDDARAKFDLAEKDPRATAEEKAYAEDDSRNAEGELLKYFRSAPKVDQLANVFFPDVEKLKREGKPLPIGMDEKELQKMQEALARGVAKGLTPSNISSLFQNLERGDQMEIFEKAAKGLELTGDDFDERNKNWFGSTGARNLGVSLETTYGVTLSEEKGGGGGSKRRQAGFASKDMGSKSQSQTSAKSEVETEAEKAEKYRGESEE